LGDSQNQKKEQKQDCLCHDGNGDGAVKDANREIGVPGNGWRVCVWFERGLGKVIVHRDSLDWTSVMGAGKVNMPIISPTR
jgi:hypothetical protein